VNRERWRRIQEVFREVAELPAGERGAFLTAECGSDAALRERVERMLAADERSHTWLDEAPAPTSPRAPELVGQAVGPYRIVRELGRGGMGAVYLAERVDVGKRVALKFVRGGATRSGHLQRFLLERRVLARLEHPNIAQLYDAGVTDDGEPYFAMEYVDGQPLDRYCDGLRLGIDARLGLFEMACAAVAVAHAGGVVHRDLKPGNILVTEPGTLETGGQVKLLDFGIAKVLEEEAGEGPTQTDVRPMTPEYAAPEQLARGPVTPATDVYALGLLLYRLLCGLAPHSATVGPSGEGGDPRWSDVTPPPPSERVMSSAADGEAQQTSEAIARARSTTPEALRTELRGELDHIVLQAIALPPAQRHPTAAELLADVRRYRQGIRHLAGDARPTRRSRPPRRLLVRAAALVGVSVPLALLGLRARSPGPAEAPSGAPSTPTVAVLPFEYAGAGEHAYLADGMVFLLSSELDGTEGVRAVKPRALLGAVTLDVASDEVSDAGAVVRHFGAPMYVTGDVTEFDGRLRINALLRDTADRVLARVPVEGQAADLFEILDQVAGRLLVAMLGRPRNSLAGSAALSSPSLPALRSYLEGESALRAGRYQAAGDAFERATTQDPDFALAHYRLSTTSTWTERTVRRGSAERAVELVATLGPVDSTRVVSWLAYLEGRASEAWRGFRSIAEGRPDDLDAWFQLGETQYHFMPSLGHPATDARRAFEQVLEFEPQNSGALTHLLRIAGIEGDSQEIEALAERLQHVEPDRTRQLQIDALAAYGGGDAVQRRRVARDLEDADPGQLQAIAVMLAVSGLDSAATGVARRLTELSSSPVQRALGSVLAAEVLVGGGRFTEAAGELARIATFAPLREAELQAALAIGPLAEPSLEALLALREELAALEDAGDRSGAPFDAPVSSPVHSFLRGMLSQRLGDNSEALAQAARLDRWPRGAVGGQEFASALARVIRATVLASQERPQEALQALADARPHWGPALPGVLQYPLAHTRWLRAELLRRVGREAEALRWYASFPDPGGYDVPYVAASHLRRAEIHERRGARAEAVREYRRFLTLWRGADPAMQRWLQAAREGLERVGGEAG
jgi:serine/threonine protein kinase/tetratricopeptide (TPR) repeat protein